MTITFHRVDPRSGAALVASAAAVLIATHGAAYFIGRANGKSIAARDSSVATQRAYQGDIKRIDSDIKRGQKAGQRVDASAQRIDRYYHQLEEDARHDAPAPVDDCVLPDIRLQRWRAANAGPFASPATAESDARADHASATGQRPNARSGIESP